MRGIDYGDGQPGRGVHAARERRCCPRPQRRSPPSRLVTRPPPPDPLHIQVATGGLYSRSWPSRSLVEPPVVLGLVVGLPIEMDEAPLYLFVLLDRNLERLANVVALPEGHILIEANVDLHQVAGPEVVSAHRVHRDDPFVVVGGDVGEGGDEGSVGRASCELLDLSLSGLHPARHDVHGDHPRAHRVHPPQRWHLRCQHHSDCRARVCDDIVHMVLRVGLNGPIVANRRKHTTAVDHEQKLGYDRHENDRVGGHGYIELTLAFGKDLDGLEHDLQ
mmetsp:Transcript_12917/g.30381  ORF Transcript_12917/g.30381 Transcript_12917/m.30381 type:complete len:276 (+) Transcript_12917:166-993(+)